MLRTLTRPVALALLIILALGSLIYYMQKKQILLVDLNLSGKNCGTLTVHADYSYKINCDDPILKERIGQALDQVLAEDKAFLRTEEMEGDRLVMKGEYLNRKDKNFVHALLISAAEQVNSEYKGLFFKFDYRL